MPPDEDHRYTFRPVAGADLPTIGAWLDQPHVAAWWDDVDDKAAEIREAMADPATRPSSSSSMAGRSAISNATILISRTPIPIGTSRKARSASTSLSASLTSSVSATARALLLRSSKPCSAKVRHG